MSKLLERRVINCPYNLARQYLEDSVAPKAASGEPSLLDLTVSAPPLNLQKTVRVTFESAVDPMHFDKPWHIHWDPQSAGYPQFDGELSVRADETYSISRLELRGAYRPPGGVAGEVFDWIVGGQIASATAQSLLERLGNEMEARYHRDEEAKKAPKSS
jgi:hypothetical protein